MLSYLQSTTWAFKAATAALLLAMSLTSAGQSRRNDIDSVSALYIYNFALFTTWSEHNGESHRTPFVLCVLGRAEESNVIGATLSEKTIKGRRIVVRGSDSVLSTDGCQVLYIGPSQVWRTQQALKDVTHLPILTVSRGANFAAQGGHIQLTLRKRKLRFIVNRSAMQKAGLALSSQVLELAIKVIVDDVASPQ